MSAHPVTAFTWRCKECDWKASAGSQVEARAKGREHNRLNHTEEAK